MSTILNVSSREVPRAGACGGGEFILAFYLPELPGGAEGHRGVFVPNAWIRIGRDEVITIYLKHADLDGAPYGAFARIVADELEADLAQIRVEPAPAESVYHHTMFRVQTNGSNSSMGTEFGPLRQVAAAARQMLLAAAAETWSVGALSCRASAGSVVHPGSQRRLSFGQLVEKASRLAPPPHPPLKHGKSTETTGLPFERAERRAQANRNGTFGMSMNVPGLWAAMWREPQCPAAV